MLDLVFLTQFEGQGHKEQEQKIGHLAAKNNQVKEVNLVLFGRADRLDDGLAQLLWLAHDEPAQVFFHHTFLHQDLDRA